VTPSPARTPTGRIFGYAIGEGAMSITMNGLANFGMLFYAQILGLNATWAGIALSITVFWDAIIDPVVGHVSDNTRTRIGRRHPYILWGGIALAFSFFSLWAIPRGLADPKVSFALVLGTNLLVRTAVAFFSIPFTALGFEICPHYEDRSRLQGIRSAFNQTVNLIFGACAWALFFRDGTAADGSRLDGTMIPDNYRVMAITLTFAALALVLISTWTTWPYAKDNRSMHLEGNNPGAFWRDLSDIFRDRLAWIVFTFFSIAQLGMLVTSQTQMFAYVHFAKLEAMEKTFVHGAGMIAFAVGAMLQSGLTRRFDKKIASYIGMATSCLGGCGLFAVFMGGLLRPEATLALAGAVIPVGKIVFGLGQVFWWGGCGMVVPLAMSMVADLSEIGYKRTGVLKDGSYAACFTFFTKVCMSVGMMITGSMVAAAGIVSGAESQSAEAARRIAAMTFLVGPALVVISFFILRVYPVNREVMRRIGEAKPGEADAILKG
jgi:GPH family glycoside/pentoside/hexuronide:cation symporter